MSVVDVNLCCTHGMTRHRRCLGLSLVVVSDSQFERLLSPCRASIHARFISRRHQLLANDSDAMRPTVLGRTESKPLALSSWVVRWSSWFLQKINALKWGFRVLHFVGLMRVHGGTILGTVASTQGLGSSYFFWPFCKVLYFWPFRIESKTCMQASRFDFFDEFRWDLRTVFSDFWSKLS